MSMVVRPNSHVSGRIGGLNLDVLVAFLMQLFRIFSNGSVEFWSFHQIGLDQVILEMSFSLIMRVFSLMVSLFVGMGRYSLLLFVLSLRGILCVCRVIGCM